MDAQIVFGWIGVIFTVVAAMWIYEQYQQRRINTIWNRMDEKQKMYFETFLDKKLYENDQKHFKELSEEKNNHMMQFISDKFEAIEDSIAELKTALKENNNHGKKIGG